MKRLLFILLLIGNLTSYSQDYKRNFNWIFGFVPSVLFNFNSGLQIDTFQYFYGTKASNSCISDTNGNYLFYTTGYFIADRYGYIMPNGNNVNCPKGNVLSNYYGGASLFDQTSIILPKKGNQYYVFSTGMSDSVANNYLNQIAAEFDILNYSIVDMDSNAGKGKVVAKNIILADYQHYVNCALQAVKHANGKDWWLVKADCANNRYQEYLVKEDTILGPFYQYATNVGDFCTFPSQLYFSEQGDKMACSMYGTILGTGTNLFYYYNQVELYDFDRCNGAITNVKTYIVPYDTSSYPNFDYKQGICFSPNGKLLYMATNYSIFQIDVEDTNTNNAVYIHGPDTTIAQFPRYNLMGIAPNGKIYVGNSDGVRKYMSYIDKPNIKGLGCDFKAQGLWQPYTNLLSPPNMPNYGLGKDTSVVCWPLGLLTYPKEGVDELLVFPNPTFGKFQIKCKNPKSKKELYNSVGQLILSTKENMIDVSNLSMGVYYLRVEHQVVKIIVE